METAKRSALRAEEIRQEAEEKRADAETARVCFAHTRIYYRVLIQIL
jgi:hypothetical protein